MATDLQNLTTIRSNLLSKMATESSNPKPSYSEDGRSFSWNEWWSMMTDRIEKLNALIQREGGPVVHRSRGRA